MIACRLPVCFLIKKKTIVNVMNTKTAITGTVGDGGEL